MVIPASDFMEVVYKGKKNTPEGIKRAYEVGLISESAMNDLLKIVTGVA